MEYLPGGDLYTYLRDRLPLSEQDSQIIVCQVLQGLALMHDRDFVHRDLKPQVRRY